MVPEPDARTRFAGQVQSLRLVMEQHPHVWVQLPLDAPCIPGRRCEQENISAQQILWLRFLGPRYLDLPAWGVARQGIGQRIHYVLRVAAGRGKDDADGSALTEVRDSIGDIGGVDHKLPSLSASDWLHLPRSLCGDLTPTRPAFDRDCATNTCRDIE
jgi:hypothetical protein